MGLLVLTSLMLGYSISRLYLEHDTQSSFGLESVVSKNPMSSQDSILADHDTSREAVSGQETSQGINVTGTVDFGSELPISQSERPHEKSTIYHTLSSKLSEIGEWTKSGLGRLSSDSISHSVLPSSDQMTSDIQDISLAGEQISGDSVPVHGDRPTIGKVSIIIGPNKLYERALRTHTAHNRLHNYQMFVLRESILDDVWTKPAYILSIILRELAKPEAERLQWLLWVDADTIILNPQIPTELFLPPNDGTWDDIHLLVTYDFNGLNNGVFPIRVHPWSVELLSAILAFRHYRPAADLTFRDQSAMAALLDAPAFRAHVLHAPQRWFNAYRGELNETLAPFQFRRGDFLVHFAGDPERPQHMAFWLQRAEAHAYEWEVALRYTTYPGEVSAFWREAAAQRAQRAEAREAAVRRVRGLMERVESALHAHGEKLSGGVAAAIAAAVQKAQQAVGDADAAAAVIDEACEALRRDAKPVLGHAEAAAKERLRAAHAAVFDAEHLLFVLPSLEVATGGLAGEVRAVEEQLALLKAELQREASDSEQLRVVTDEMVTRLRRLEDGIDRLQDEADRRGSTQVAHKDGGSGSKQEIPEQETSKDAMAGEAPTEGSLTNENQMQRLDGEIEDERLEKARWEEAERVKKQEAEGIAKGERMKAGLPAA
ncbi:hypothetical protein FH972_023704 [Carpinus fangiana]|uniref:Glycosyltransferase family 34 protein n=1 Tax=Carpinus fangiana TaxID=176857 RepID=A0A5N6KWG3_9ROSI|nr:hypothetical protein FH972_023704 [Carpinus fangiana]